MCCATFKSFLAATTVPPRQRTSAAANNNRYYQECCGALVQKHGEQFKTEWHLRSVHCDNGHLDGVFMSFIQL